MPASNNRHQKLTGYRLDALLSRAALATERSATNRKRYASALRILYGRTVTRSATCRHHQPNVHAPVSRVLLTLDALARGEGTSAWPVVAEGLATVIQADIRTVSTPALEARLRQLTEREHDLEAEENRQTARGDDHDAAALADVREAEVQLERAAIRRELAERARR